MRECLYHIMRLLKNMWGGFSLLLSLHSASRVYFGSAAAAAILLNYVNEVEERNGIISACVRGEIPSTISKRQFLIVNATVK